MQPGGTTSGLEGVLERVTPELEAVLLLARTSIDEVAEQRMNELVAGGLAWTAVIDAARNNQVLPLVASNLLLHHGNDLPPATASHVADYARDQTARNMMLTAELFRMLDAFTLAGISAFPYKGPTLAVTAYGSIRYRQFGDLDILVPKNQYLQAIRVLGDQGFSPVQPGPPGEQRYLRGTSAHAFVKDTVHIDLQWASTFRKALSIPIGESLWTSTDEVEVLGRAVRSIPADVLFIFLCAHGARHQWDRLKWVCDVAEMIRTHTDLDWTDILLRADQAGARRVVNMALVLADSLAGAPVPTDALNVARQDQTAVDLAALALRHHLISEAGLLGTANSQLKFTIKTKERTRDQIQFLVEFVFHPTTDDYEWVTLPDWASFLYSFLRPFRLAYRTATGGLKAESGHSH